MMGGRRSIDIIDLPSIIVKRASSNLSDLFLSSVKVDVTPAFNGCDGSLVRVIGNDHPMTQ